MRLIREAAFRGESRQIRVRARGIEAPQEAAEAENSLERLRAISDAREEAPAQLPLAQAELLGHGGRASVRVGQPPRRRGDEPVGRAGLGELSGGEGYLAQRGCRREVGIEAPGEFRQELTELDANVTEFVERVCERGAAGPGAEARPDQDRAGRGRADDRTGVGTGYERFLARAPDEVAAGIWENPNRRAAVRGNGPDPEAGERPSQRLGGRELAIAVRDSHAHSVPMSVSFKTRTARSDRLRGMTTPPDIDAAIRFLAGNARLLDRRRFERLFADGDAGPVRAAVAAYRNDNGGFGHALEPDGRTPGSQPAAVQLGLRTLHEADAWDDELVRGALDWLERTAPAEGGAVFVAPGIEAWPHAPWWAPVDGLPPSLITTGPIAGTLHARAVEHPWLSRATELLWRRIDDPGDLGSYDVRGVFAFLQYVPDRDRATAAVEEMGKLLFERGLVELDPDAAGEVHGPLDFAPLPDSIARRLFDQPTIEAHLDHLAGRQLEDGGWTFNWPAWSPLAEMDWRGSLTVDALSILAANGRWSGDAAGAAS